MTALEVRRIPFDFGDDLPFVWNPRNVAFSTFMNVVSVYAVAFEKMIVAAVREAIPLIDDEGAAQEAKDFLRQEAQHSACHRRHLKALVRHYPGLEQTFDAVIASFDEITETRSLEYRLAYIADLEATFTPFFKLLLDNEDVLFRPGDDRVSSLLLWHFVEEVEHRSSALVIYGAVVDSDWYRVRVLPSVLRHLLAAARIVADGMNEHVPFAERGMDAHDIKPALSMRTALLSRIPGVTPKTAPVLPALGEVPWREKLVSGFRIMLSQTPFHDPATEPLPDFADIWFERYRRGGDVAHWYGASDAAADRRGDA
ncbi:metal-dependent hydrolase [Gordonia pseudamarae]|jgi:predicted metal-dependent hydrolase|uniref:Metal-dependent hydrolase n=1 Tax=Gordonia pseudamarae TaxID=2831662 RepID=A0ABX6IK79_9ACTN|nr:MULTISPECIES: metal-dependent hydrolase [Gordonia]MBD0022574.1 metal-dependent hydrolase [Gordonia sp. (in: high G+C Gram-positive bacteria)]QHN26860.1 metal-dependent hydrolase [Gordonia pseudamarae]QHN35751.1 metal-dependent hydrolase [Gordonia pseudamarae]